MDYIVCAGDISSMFSLRCVCRYFKRYVDAKQRHRYVNNNDLLCRQMSDGKLYQPPIFHIIDQCMSLEDPTVLCWNSRLCFKTVGGTQRGCTLLHWVSDGFRYPVLIGNESIVSLHLS